MSRLSPALLAQRADARNEWTRAIVTIMTRMGPEDVRGYVCADAPGLAVTPVVEAAYRGAWAVTHIASGRGTDVVSFDAENVMGFALALARLGDWTRDVDTIWNDGPFYQASRQLATRLLASGEYIDTGRPVDDGMPEHIKALRREAVDVGA